MTRELSPRAGAALLRTTFSAKGSPITQTEALDLVAKLKGFNAWSHMQQHEGKTTPVAVAAPVAVESHKVPLREISLKEVLIQHYGLEGDCPLFSRESWKTLMWPWMPNPPQTYWDWFLKRLEASEISWGSTPFTFKRNNQVKVTLPDGTLSVWNFEQNLTDRCGDLNSYMAETKPGLALLTLDEALLAKLRSEMYDETTFVGRKDGQLGVYYEMEFLSIESEASDREEGNDPDLKPHAEIVTMLLAGIRKLEPQFPNVQFCIPDESQIIHDRPAVWAFVKSGTLSETDREALGDALFKL
jgi:hypothetical protein